MKKAFHYLALSSLVFSLLLTSCVSSKKFKASEARADKLQQDKAVALGQLNDCNLMVKNLKDDKASLQNENALVQDDLSRLCFTRRKTIVQIGK